MFVTLGLFSFTLFPIVFLLEIETDWFGQSTGERSTLSLIDSDRKSYYLGTEIKGNFFQAEQFCRYHGMELLSITSMEENDFILKSILKTGRTYERFYTSGSRLGDNKRWVWMSTGRPFKFTNWYAGEPNDAADWDEKCVEVILHQGVLRWNDVECVGQLHFICEISWPKDCFKVLQRKNSTEACNDDEFNQLYDLRHLSHTLGRDAANNCSRDDVLKVRFLIGKHDSEICEKEQQGIIWSQENLNTAIHLIKELPVI